MTNLPSSLNEGLAFDVANRSTDFGDDDIRPGLFLSLEAHAPLDFIGDVGNDLDGVAEVFAPALLRNHLLINLPCRHVGGA